VIRIRRQNAEDVLPSNVRSYLNRKSAEASKFPAGDARINTAWASFLGTAARRHVEAALDAQTRGKCAYCEAVAARDIEHFYPKSAYPARMFSWENVLKGCKNCNNAKVDRFPLDRGGRPLLIDPCSDEPLEYFVWDQWTGATGVSPIPALQPRALATRELFGLDQEPLREERRNKSLDVLYLLARVTNEDPVTPETRNRLYDHLQGHRPWLGIIRQLLTRPSDREGPLVNAALTKLPEIRTWTADWL
jgi:uncharacterized protein (TIGR02646 family)